MKILQPALVLPSGEPLDVAMVGSFFPTTPAGFPVPTAAIRSRLPLCRRPLLSLAFRSSLCTNSADHNCTEVSLDRTPCSGPITRNASVHTVGWRQERPTAPSFVRQQTTHRYNSPQTPSAPLLPAPDSPRLSSLCRVASGAAGWWRPLDKA